MRKTLLFILAIFCLAFTVKAQDDSDYILQLSGQASLPVGELSRVSKGGFGGALKGLYDLDVDQMVTLEGGYNYFKVKNLPTGISAYYSAIPIYAGYRFSIRKIHLEPQAGISINRVAGSTGAATSSQTSTKFGFAGEVSYSISNFEIGVKYQSSQTTNKDEEISFVGFRLSYNLEL
jgi:hypothetical protein